MVWLLRAFVALFLFVSPVLSYPDYHYRATVNRVIDGDTIVVDLKLGMNVVLENTHIRLFGVNAPETNTADGKAVKKLVEGLLPPGSEIILQTIKDKTGKYGRYLGIVYLPDHTQLNSYLLDNDHAKPEK